MRFVLVLLVLSGANLAHAQRYDETHARGWVGALDGLSIASGLAVLGAHAAGARRARVGAVSGIVWGVSGPIAHLRVQHPRHRSRFGWSLALRSVLPLAHGMLGHTAELQHDLRQPTFDPYGNLYGMVAGMALGAAVAAIFEQAWLLSDRPLTPAKKVTMIVILSLVATIAVASFIPVWDAHYEATDDRVP